MDMNKKQCLLFFFCLMALQLAASNISISSFSGTPGATVQVPVNIDDATGIDGCQVKVSYNPSVLQATVPSKGSLISGWPLGTNNYTIDHTEGWIRIVTYDPSSEGLSGGAGSLVVLNFTVIGNVGDTSVLNFLECKITDVMGATLPSTPINGLFKVSGYTLAGKITLSGGLGVITDVTVALTGTVNANTYPNAQGNYSFTNVPSGSYVVTPSLATYSFEPASRNYSSLSSDILNADFAGSSVAILTVVSERGSPTPSVGNHTYYTGGSISVSVVSPVAGGQGTRYLCTGWTGAGSVPVSGSSTSTSFTINKDSSIIWNWQTQHLLTVQVQPSGVGEININPSGNWYNIGTNVTLTAVASSGYLFSHWQGDIPAGQTTTSPLTITMDGPKTITAVFVVESQELSVNPESASFTFNISDQSAPNQKTADINISNIGQAGILNWTTETIVYKKGNGWITVAPSSGSLQPGKSQTMVFTVNKTGMTIGTYTAKVPIVSNGGNKEIEVVVNITTNDRIISIPDSTASPGVSVQIPVNIDHAEGVAGFQCTVRYNPAVLQATAPARGTLTSGWGLGANNYNINNTEGWINIITYDLEGLPEGSGSLILLNFNVIGSPGQTSAISCSDLILSTSTASKIPSVAVDGTFTIGGYTISGNITLYGGGSFVTGVMLSLSGASSATTFPDAQGNYSFSNVMPGSYTITPSLNGYRFEPANRSYSNIHGHLSSQNFTGIYQVVLTVISSQGSPEPAVGQHMYDYNTDISASVASPANEANGARYFCTGWTGTGSVPVSGATTSVSFKITQPSSLTWNWRPQYLVSVIVDGNGNVTSNIVGDNSWYDSGSTVVLTAVPAAGWFFSHWQQADVSIYQNPLSLTVSGPKNLTAHFQQISFSLHPETPIAQMVLDDNTSYETLIAVGIEYIGDFTETINLSGSVAPATDKITLELMPEKILYPDEGFLLDIGISDDIRPDTYIITIKGQGGGIENSAVINLVANTKIYIPTLYAFLSPNTTYVDIPVNITNAGGLKNFQFALLYDPLMLDLSQTITSGSLTSGWTITAQQTAPGRFDIFGSGSESLGTGNGSLSVIKARIVDATSFPKEGIPLRFDGVVVLNSSGRLLPYVTSTDRLFLMIKGDINIDYEVNILDVILCLRMSVALDVEVQGESYSSGYPDWLVIRGDINGDGEVDISDVILTLRKSVGLD